MSGSYITRYKSIPSDISVSRLYFNAMKLCLLSLLVLSSAFSQTFAQSSDPDTMSDEELVDALMQASGFDLSLLDVWYGIEESINAERELASGEATKVRQLLRAGFYGERLVSEYRNRLSRDLNNSHATRVITFLQSETGQHILEKETREANATDAELQDFAASFDPHDSSSSVRVELVRTMMSETQAMENTTAILHALYSNLLLTANAAENEPSGRMSDSEFEATSGLIRSQLDQQIGQYIIISMLYTFRDADISHLEAYNDHLRSDAGRWYTSTLHDILIEVLEDAHQTVRNEIRLTDS
ncbi:MAG: hypothetical protein LAT84_03200 [Balneolia bacterium]|nr:hypothetical protein [Balneolia bacterium]